MSYETIIDVVSTVGFPMFVATWLMLRSDRIVHELTVAVREVRDELRREKK